MKQEQIVEILETCLLVAGRPLSMEDLLGLFDEIDAPSREDVKAAIEALEARWAERTLELVKVATGYRFQARTAYIPWVSRLFEERPPRYSRATLETLAVIVYRQPATRAVIEDVRGVSVSTQIIKTLLERGWIRIVGHRDVPGKPALYGTTKQFLDDFNMSSLTDLPPLAELSPDDHLQTELELPGESELPDESELVDDVSQNQRESDAELQAQPVDTEQDDDNEVAEMVAEAELEVTP